MEHIKNFNENWKDSLDSDLIRKKNSYEIRYDSYHEKFKKKFEQRTKEENILVECLYNLENFTIDRRYLGVAEGVFHMIDYFKKGEKFDYKEKEEKFLFVRYKTKERYSEYIIRKIKEYLTEKGVL